MLVCRRLLALLLGAWLPCVQSLFEDEVGQYEWIVQQVGQPTALASLKDKDADKVFVASASGVVSSVLMEDGTLNWRRVAEPRKRVKLLRASDSKLLLSATETGLVQCWRGNNGELVWQKQYSKAKFGDVSNVFFQGKLGIVVSEMLIEARSDKGADQWKQAPDGNAHFWAAVLGTGKADGTVCAISAGKGGSDAKLVQIRLPDGEVSQRADAKDFSSVAKAMETSKYLVVDSHIVVLSGKKITAYPICGGDSLTHDLDSSGFHLMPWQNSPGVFAVTNGAQSVVFGLSGERMKLLKKFDGVAVVGPVHSADDNAMVPLVAVAMIGPEGTKIQLMDPTSGNAQAPIFAGKEHDDKTYTYTDHGPGRLLLMRELLNGTHRTVISAADHSLAGLRDDKVRWVREEALASIRQAAFHARASDNMIKKEDAAFASVLPALVAQLSQLPVFVGQVAQIPANLVAAANNYISGFGKEPKRGKPTLLPNGKAPSSAEELKGFGASKLIICATSANKLFALEATTSEIVWHRYFPTSDAFLGDSSCTGNAGKGRCGLWMQSMPSTSAIYSELVVVTPISSDSSTPQHLFWLDPVTGKEIRKEVAPSKAGIVSLMTLPGAKQVADPVQPFIVIDAGKNVHAMPRPNTKEPFGQEIVSRFNDNFEKLFHFEVDRANNVIEGFAIEASADKSSHKLLRLWNIDFGSVNESIVQARSPEHREWDHVPVHIKGDASILYKYINPNMLAVATESSEKESSGKESSFLNLYVMDSVTGRVLHQSKIPGGSAPVHMAVCDNWVLAHYRNRRNSRFELTVVEFFESKPDDGPWKILFGGSQSHQSTSAHHLETPVSLQQSYIFNEGVTSMGVTATLKGITPRSVIMSLSKDQLYRISKDMLNPRRPYMSSAGVVDKDKTTIPSQFAPTKEEPVPPYHATMPYRPTDVLTYDNSMKQVDGIISSPTGLESTALVFSHGLDLFFTPVQSAKAYDVLSPGFNYGLLFASVGTVVVALAVTSFLSSIKQLNERWK